MSVPSNIAQIVLPQLNVKEIKDQVLQKNFSNLQSYFLANNQLLGFKFFDLVFTKANPSYNLVHGLGVVPQDVIVTKITGSGAVTFNWGLSTNVNLNLTISGACHIRFFVGTYWQNSGSTSQTDITEFSAQSTTPTYSPPTVTKYLSALSGTYTPPSGFLYIDVQLVGGGGGGQAGLGAGTAGTAGGNTTFGTNLLIAGGGSGGINNTTGGAGGVASVSTNISSSGYLVLVSQNGGAGGAAGYTNAGVEVPGGMGGASLFGPGGANGGINQYGGAPPANSGGGGGGGNSEDGGGSESGVGGGSGAYIRAILSSAFISKYYSSGIPYKVGSAGKAGSTNNSGNGALGAIVITEYYQ